MIPSKRNGLKKHFNKLHAGINATRSLDEIAGSQSCRYPSRLESKGATHSSHHLCQNRVDDDMCIKFMASLYPKLFIVKSRKVDISPVTSHTHLYKYG